MREPAVERRALEPAGVLRPGAQETEASPFLSIRQRAALTAQLRFEADKNLASLGFCSLNLIRWAGDDMAEVHIISYFSLETDLANEMTSWPEFKSGSGYAVELATLDQLEVVSVVLVEQTADESAYVRITGTAAGPLFDRVLGRVTYALSAHSDNLIVDRVV